MGDFFSLRVGYFLTIRNRCMGVDCRNLPPHIKFHVGAGFLGNLIAHVGNMRLVRIAEKKCHRAVVHAVLISLYESKWKSRSRISMIVLLTPDPSRTDN